MIKKENHKARPRNYLQELVNHVDGHEESLLEQLELGVDLNQPVDQYPSHPPVDKVTEPITLLTS